MTTTPKPPACLVRIAKPLPVPGTGRSIYAVLNRCFTETEALAWLAENPTHRRVVNGVVVGGVL